MAASSSSWLPSHHGRLDVDTVLGSLQLVLASSFPCRANVWGVRGSATYGIRRLAARAAVARQQTRRHRRAQESLGARPIGTRRHVGLSIQASRWGKTTTPRILSSLAPGAAAAKLQLKGRAAEVSLGAGGPEASLGSLRCFERSRATDAARCCCCPPFVPPLSIQLVDGRSIDRSTHTHTTHLLLEQAPVHRSTWRQQRRSAFVGSRG